MEKTTQQSKGKILTERLISIVCILFLLFDAITKIFKESHSVSGTISLGFSENFVQVIGILGLICTIFYIIPRTAVIGALLLTAYMGGAVSIMVRAGQPFYFPIVFAILIWLGLYLRDRRINNLFSKGNF